MALLGMLVAMGVWTGSARALSYTQHNLSFTGLGEATGVAVDPSENVYVGDLANRQVLESRAYTSQQFPQQTLPFSGLFDPEAIAVDSAGDVFAADGFNNRVVEVPPGPGKAGEKQKTLPFTGLGDPFGVAVDPPGDVFASDLTNNRVLELPRGGGAQQTVPFAGLDGPEGLAIDSSLDLFVADTGNNRVLELSPGGTQQTLPFSGLSEPTSVAVDRVGDVFVVDHQNSRVLELPVGGSQQVLPFNGLDKPTGVAVDSAGAVFVADGGDVIELYESQGTSPLAVTPGSGPAGSQVALTGLDQCPLGGAFSSTRATYSLSSPSGAVLESETSTLDRAGYWSGTLNIPADAANGTTYLIDATCQDAEGVITEEYISGAFAVTPPLTGPVGPAGPAGQQGQAGTNGTNGLNGATGETGPQGATGPQGPVGPAGKSPSSSTITCKLVFNVTTCTVTYRYTAAAGAARDARVEATARIHGRNVILGRGTMRGHQLRVTLKHLHPGRYRVTVRELRGHGKSVVLERTTLTVT